VNDVIGEGDARFETLKELFLAGGYEEPPAEFQEVHCHKERFQWIANGFAQTFSTISEQKCRVCIYSPAQELQPHCHDIDEDFLITHGALDLWTWPADGAADGAPPAHQRLAAGDRITVPSGTKHCLRVDRMLGCVFHETVGEDAFVKRSTEFLLEDPGRVMPSVYAGRTVLITGANRGLGLGFAQAFTQAGARVIAACRDPEKADVLKAICPAPTLIQLDLSSEESLAALAGRLADAGVDSLDYLINNAGISVPNHPVDPILETTPALLRPVLDVNVVGTISVTQACLPLLEKSDMKTVVMLSSQLGSVGSCWAMQGRKGGVSSYRISRAANNMAMRCFGGELQEQGFIFVSMSPGHVATDMGSSGGRSPPLTVEQSVGGMLGVIGRLGRQHNGRFLQFDGQELPW
jgi:NAD(P)-dependent dehydrogenase (short-subunit alcohol dehydrogenase family)